MKISSALIFLIWGVSGFTLEKKSFPSVWQSITEISPLQESSRVAIQSVHEAQDRARRHWLPRVYIDSQNYQTNDPGNSFFGVLEQRSLQNIDLNMDSMNRPEIKSYTRAAIGIDFPLYEGGMKVSQVKMLQHAQLSEEKSARQKELDLYSQVGLAFGSIGVFENKNIKLQELNNEINKLLRAYQLGNRSNPVGYSGLLGLKSMSNRVEGLLKLSEAHIKGQFAILHEMGIHDNNWSPEIKDSMAYVQMYFENQQMKESKDSFRMESLQEDVLASQQMTEIEKSKFLPRVGLFAEDYSFSGNRNTATGYTAGIYLKWNLYDPSVFGTMNESRLKSLAIEKKVEFAKQQERAEIRALKDTIISLKENIKLLKESEHYLEEQFRMAETLFKNGSIHTLQLIEVLNRRLDLIEQQSEIEINFLKAATLTLSKEQFNIPVALKSGAPK